MDALLTYRSRHALPSWEATVRALLDKSAAAEPPGADPFLALTGTTGRTDP
jgi:hypothetical protein